MDKIICLFVLFCSILFFMIIKVGNCDRKGMVLVCLWGLRRIGAKLLQVELLYIILNVCVFVVCVWGDHVSK